MKMKFAALMAALVLLCPNVPQAREKATDEALATVVLLQRDLGGLHYMFAPGERPYVDTTTMYNHAAMQMPQATAANIAAGALGGAIGSLIATQMVLVDAQQQRDKVMQPLLDPLGEDGVEEMIRIAFAQALAGHGMQQRGLAVYQGASAPKEKMFERMRVAQEARRFLIVRNGQMTSDLVPTPVLLHHGQRQLRFAAELELREGKRGHTRLLAKRDVLVHTDPIQVPEGVDPLEALAADDHRLLREAINDAVRRAVDLAFADMDLPKPGKDAKVGVINELGLEVFPAAVIDVGEEGRARLWTRHKTLVSMPADSIVEGEELEAAIEAEEARQKAESEAVAGSAETEAADAEAADAGEAVAEDAAPNGAESATEAPSEDDAAVAASPESVDSEDAGTLAD